MATKGTVLNFTMTAATDQVVPGAASGFEYIVSADADCWLRCGGAAAVGVGLFVPAKMPMTLPVTGALHAFCTLGGNLSLMQWAAATWI